MTLLIPLFITTLFCCLIHFSQAVPVSSKIIGGQQVQAGAYPFQVSLADIRYVSRNQQQRRQQSEQTKINTHICGGVLLSKNWVVTAAHCVMNPNVQGQSVVPANWLGVGVGTNDLVDVYNKGYIGIQRIYVHPQFDMSRWRNDIALLHLSTPVDQSAYRQGHYEMGCLANNQNIGGRLWSIGWGNTVPITENTWSGQWSPHQPSRWLKQLTVKDVSTNGNAAPFCQGRTDLVCIHAIQQNTGPCRGDSGGALVSSNKKVVVGVYSFMKMVPVNGNNQYQAMCVGDGQYTRVSTHVRWIQSVMNERFCTARAS